MGAGHRGDSSGEASFSEASVSCDQHHVLERELKSWLFQPAERPSANPFAPLSLGFFIGSVGMMASDLSLLPGISWGLNKAVAGKALCRSKVTIGVQSSLTVLGCRHGWLVSVLWSDRHSLLARITAFTTGQWGRWSSPVSRSAPAGEWGKRPQEWTV